MHLQSTGSGSPTVVLDSGLGGGGLSWAPIQSEVAKFTRVISYDRAGLGWSDRSPADRTTKQMAHELKVYDPDGGFVTGGGWIYSPPSSLSLDPSAEGRASFGFVAKYKKGGVTAQPPTVTGTSSRKTAIIDVPTVSGFVGVIPCIEFIINAWYACFCAYTRYDLMQKVIYIWCVDKTHAGSCWHCIIWT